MVATDMMQRYKKLQFERGESAGCVTDGCRVVKWVDALEDAVLIFFFSFYFTDWLKGQEPFVLRHLCGLLSGAFHFQKDESQQTAFCVLVFLILPLEKKKKKNLK